MDQFQHAALAQNAWLAIAEGSAKTRAQSSSVARTGSWPNSDLYTTAGLLSTVANSSLTATLPGSTLYVGLSSNVGSGVTTNASSFTSGNSAAPDGTQVAFLQGAGAAYQTVSGLTIGATYRLTEAAAQRDNRPGGQLGNPYEVRVDGTAIATVSANQGAASYSDFSQYFTATRTSHSIGFYGTNANATATYPDNTVLVDNVRGSAFPAAASTASTANFIWLANSTGTLTQTDEQGATQTSNIGTGNTGVNTFGGVAIDAAGGVWSVTSGNNLVNYIASASAANLGSYNAATFNDPSLNAPSSIAIDGAGMVWITNYGSNVVSVFTSAGVLAGTVSDTSINGPTGIAVDQSGNVWVADSNGNTVDEILGGAAPSAPLSVAVTSNTPGVKP